jgi:hypothetical protein
MLRPFRAVINFVASLVGNFVAFVESDRESSREGAKPRRMGAANGRQCTRIEFDGAAGRETAKIAKMD